MFNSVDEIEQKNRASGRHFFSPDTMRFFKSRILSGLWGGRYFVTSEEGPHGPRRYTLRRADDDGSIKTVGRFQQYRTTREAKAAAKRMISKEVKWEPV